MSGLSNNILLLIERICKYILKKAAVSLKQQLNCCFLVFSADPYAEFAPGAGGALPERDGRPAADRTDGGAVAPHQGGQRAGLGGRTCTRSLLRLLWENKVFTQRRNSSGHEQPLCKRWDYSESKIFTLISDIIPNSSSILEVKQ